MNEQLLKSDKISKIRLIEKKEGNWCSAEKVKVKIENIDVFLQEHNQFVNISAKKIINLEFVGRFSFDPSAAYIEIANTQIKVSRRFVPYVRSAFILFLSQRNKSLDQKSAVSMNKNDEKKRGTYLHVFENKISRKVDFKGIKYLFRDGSLTSVLFEDGKVRNYYESLKVFENKYLEKKDFLRINRNCIINTKHLSWFNINLTLNRGEVKIGTDSFKISRRSLVQFKLLVGNYTTIGRPII
ncbi:hypothetical protein EMA8858_03818 [Emticicia aquatica]|uniref:HTH LytTR-type domain-containing protein n=1 Tax=Emticicia aquatica TaxID=1681835 RepID=A0ABN8F0I3_9BACT|nr:LytTR family transcriptional regulator DNA-binding domain-containing protein [Emticicia aquatica]CAH0997684.1 hypothetical protein EMA8858_03818 [Emticicia aquatica]